MISLRDIGLRYDDHVVLRDVNLDIDEGEFVLVAGRTGVGKSTLLGVFNGLVPTFTGGTLSGAVLIDGVDVTERPPRDRADLVGYVGQDPSASFVTDTVEEELAFGPEQLGLDAATMRRRVEETLDLLGIAELRDRDLRTLSGGQQQRVAIGAVLTMHPRVLVLDEPTSALDPTAAEEVLATLTRLVTDVGLTVVVAEHRLERVVPFADSMVLLNGDGTVTVGTPAEVLRDSPVAPPIVELGRTLGWSPLPLTVREARRSARGTQVQVQPQQAMSAPRAPMLQIEGLTVNYGRRTALREVTLDVGRGSITAVMGRNGAGKSTLLWAIQGSRASERGRVLVHGRERVATQIGLVPQTPADLLYLETVADECRTADADHAEVEMPSALELLERLAPGIDSATQSRDLSEGQRLALVLAVVLRAGPRAVSYTHLTLPTKRIV